MTILDRIVVDPHILVGKPVVRGTRLAVEFIIGHGSEKQRVRLTLSVPGLAK